MSLMVKVWCPIDRCLGFAMLSPRKLTDRCFVCSETLTIRPPEDTSEKPVIQSCLHCGCPNLHLEKAFPQALGCVVMVVSAIVAVIFALPTKGLSFLGIIVLDFILYFFVPMRTVCYQCSAEYYKMGKNVRHKGHDLLIAGKYADSEDVGGPAGH